MKKTSKILIAVVALIALASVAFTVFPASAQKKADEKKVIDTTVMCKDVLGHHAATPVKITIVGGKIQSVEALPSDETPSFYQNAVKILDAFKGMTVKEALESDVDAISGCTMSCEALKENIKAGLKSIQK
ncbi:MAG: FMN-binding protein [Bacteroidales bacterium]|nr:FMN-binding protein [Bacteroidales bacterium]